MGMHRSCTSCQQRGTQRWEGRQQVDLEQSGRLLGPAGCLLSGGITLGG